MDQQITQTTNTATAPQAQQGGAPRAPRPQGAMGSRPPFRRGPGGPGAAQGGGQGGFRSRGGFRGRPRPGGAQGAPGQQAGTGAAGSDRGRGGFRGRGRGGDSRGGGRDGRRGGPDRKPDFEQKMIDIRRVTRVVAGGRRFSFSVALVAGDRNGRVGFGMGKATDTSLAIEKAFKQARKDMLTLRLTKTKSIRHDVTAKFGSASLSMMPNKGRGLIAGSAARVVLAYAGVKDVTAKYHSGTKNKINNAKAAIEALRVFAYKHGEAPVKKVEMPVAEVQN